MNSKLVKKIITSRINKYFVDVGETEFELNVKKIPTGKYTKAFSCEARGIKIPMLFIKTKKKGVDDKDVFNEYETLDYLWGIGFDKEKKHGIPKVYDYIDEQNLVVTEFVEGRKLSNILAYNLVTPLYFLSRKKLERHIIGVSDWLCKFENIIYSDKTDEIGEYIDYFCEKKIRGITFIDTEEKNRLKKALYGLGNIHNTIPVHLINTDFKPHNIIINNDKVTAIDWEKTKRNGLAFWMASGFIRTLENASTRRAVSKKNVAILRNLFLDNYWQKSIFREFNGIFDLVYVLESITSLAECVSSLNNSPPSRTEKASLARIKDILGI